MKRFRSSVQKVHEICRQQCRMAEIAFARQRTLKEAAEARRDMAQDACDAAHRAVQATLKTGVGAASILGLHRHLEAAADQLTGAERTLQLERQKLDEARKHYDELKAREEGLSRIVSSQRQKHRKKMFDEQQRAVDDAAAFRWARANAEQKVN